MKRIAALIIACSIASAAMAQIPRFVTTKFTNVPVEDAIARVFQPLHMKYELKPDVKGMVSIDAVRSDFSDVLRDILLQSDAISEMVDGVYTIRPIQHPQQPRTKTIGIPQDMLLGKVSYENADVRLVLKELFGLGGVKFSIAPEVQGIVMMDLHNVSLETAIRNVLKQVDASSKVTATGLEISRIEWSPKSSEVPPPAGR
jgi:hypothetical protein